MDEELRRHLDAMLRKITDGRKIILKRLTSLERNFQNTKGFLLNDAVVAGGATTFKISSVTSRKLTRSRARSRSARYASPPHFPKAPVA